MMISNILDKARTEKIKRERANAMWKLIAGMGISAAVGAGVALVVLFAAKPGKEIQIKMKNTAENMAETIKDTVEKKTDTVKNGVTHATDEVFRVIKAVDGKIEAIKAEMKDGKQDIKQDIHETAKNISKEFSGTEK